MLIQLSRKCILNTSETPPPGPVIVIIFTVGDVCNPPGCPSQDEWTKET